MFSPPTKKGRGGACEMMGTFSGSALATISRVPKHRRVQPPYAVFIWLSCAGEAGKIQLSAEDTDRVASRTGADVRGTEDGK